MEFRWKRNDNFSNRPLCNYKSNTSQKQKTSKWILWEAKVFCNGMSYCEIRMKMSFLYIILLKNPLMISFWQDLFNPAVFKEQLTMPGVRSPGSSLCDTWPSLTYNTCSLGPGLNTSPFVAQYVQFNLYFLSILT